MSVINNFMSYYMDHRLEYEKIRDQVQSIIENQLHDAGIMAIPSSRIKANDRLMDKLVTRNKTRLYQSIDDIISDIPDLIGARIALYFPNDKMKIKSLLEHSFEIAYGGHQRPLVRC